MKTRTFDLTIILKTYKNDDNFTTLTRYTTMKVQGNSKINADKVRQIVRQLCEILLEMLSDSEIEELINK